MNEEGTSFCSGPTHWQINENAYPLSKSEVTIMLLKQFQD
jgi:hypothetical protein